MEILQFDFDDYIMEPVHRKCAPQLHFFCTSNSNRLKRFFPITLEQNLTKDLSERFAEKKTVQFDKEEEFLFVLKERLHSAIIGLVYLKEIDRNAQQGELAYAIGRQYEGKGIITRAVAALSNHVFDHLGLNTLQIIAHKTNFGSIKVATTNNFVWKATLPKAYAPPSELPLDMELYERYA